MTTMISSSSALSAEYWSDLQGNILEPHGRHYAIHLFLSFGFKYNSHDVRAWIRRLHSTITSAWQEASIGRSGGFLSLLLTHSGYLWLGKTAPSDVAFASGMKERGKALLDPPVSEWEQGYQKGIDALLILANHDPVVLAEESVRIKVSASRAGLSIVAEEPGYRLLRGKSDIEHFGHVDGISQPTITVALNAATDPLVIADPAVVLVKQPPPQSGFGSFLVFRKLEQNVALWNRNIKALAATLQMHPDHVAALIMGRFPDGTPLLSHTQRLFASASANDFTYQNDLYGDVCPLHAHIRKTNPRKARAERIPRIVRRGMSYGIRPDLHLVGRKFPLPSRGVGLLFMCYQKDIQNQFEYIQQVANENDLPQSGSGTDPVIGQGPLKPGSWRPPHFGKGIDYIFERTVTLKGGEYFFAPSISLLATV